ncbi:MAG: hypothetical protein U0175_05755 [Caldilineaceae bacterium]
MTITEVHARLANTCNLFLAALTLWAFLLWLRKQPLSGGWFGAMVIYEVLTITESLIGGYLHVQGFSAALDRPWLHILYAVNAILVLPAAYVFFNSIEDERAKALAMTLIGVFAWWMLQRNFSTGQPIHTGIQALWQLLSTWS